MRYCMFMASSLSLSVLMHTAAKLNTKLFMFLYFEIKSVLGSAKLNKQIFKLLVHSQPHLPVHLMHTVAKHSFELT